MLFQQVHRSHWVSFPRVLGRVQHHSARERGRHLASDESGVSAVAGRGGSRCADDAALFLWVLGSEVRAADSVQGRREAAELCWREESIQQAAEAENRGREVGGT